MEEQSRKNFYKYEYPKWWKEESKHYEFGRYYNYFLGFLDVSGGEQVLDCGIGTGKPFASTLENMGIEIWGIDIAFPLLVEAKRNLKGNRIIVGDCEQLPFTGEFFDRTYCLNSSWYFPNLKKVLSEMLRVTRTNGIIVFDIINSWHITSVVNYIWSNVKPILGKHSGPLKIRSPLGVRKILRHLECSYEVKGFYVLLPTSFPVLGERANLAQYSNFASFGLQNSRIKVLGQKLIYIVRKGI